jgi:inorganic pyrophosphatase
MEDSDFWLRLDELVATCEVFIDRPKGSPHPRFPAFSYPLDYGYLQGTRSGDGEGIDIWIGSLPGRRVTAVVCTLDFGKRDAELKILVGCTQRECQAILDLHSFGASTALLVERARD